MPGDPELFPRPAVECRATACWNVVDGWSLDVRVRFEGLPWSAGESDRYSELSLEELESVLDAVAVSVATRSWRGVV